MSILDGMYSGNIDAGTLANAIRQTIDTAREQNPEVAKLLELMGEGYSLADLLDLGDQHKEALFQLGCRLLTSGQSDQAAAIFTTLSLLDPLEARALYGLGVTEQCRGNLRAAAQLFIQFLALDATNPDGYLRLGECLIAAKEIEEARAALQTALKLAEHGYGEPGTDEEARRLLEQIETLAS